MYATLTAI